LGRLFSRRTAFYLAKTSYGRRRPILFGAPNFVGGMLLMLAISCFRESNPTETAHSILSKLYEMKVAAYQSLKLTEIAVDDFARAKTTSYYWTGLSSPRTGYRRCGTSSAAA